jgi:hypothetical protein
MKKKISNKQESINLLKKRYQLDEKLFLKEDADDYILQCNMTLHIADYEECQADCFQTEIIQTEVICLSAHRRFSLCTVPLS